MSFKPTKLHALEFRVFQDLSKIRSDWSGKRVLVACSGGMDSVVLSSVLARVLPRLGASVALASIHHGRTDSPSVERARRLSLSRVSRLARELEVEFFAARPANRETILLSEASLRRFRMKALARLRLRHGFDFVAFAHHADDLLETRLIRLARGTGPVGLTAMSELSGWRLRPFLDLSRARLASYAIEKKLDWIEDPANLDPGPLRNWMRTTWLPALEAKRPGSIACLARSLESLTSVESFEFERGEIDRKDYLRLDITKRRGVIAAYLRSIGARGFGATHVEELRKRIETARNQFRFQLLKFEWYVNAGQIRAVRVSDAGSTPRV